MKITRDGKEIELDPGELYEAYKEYEHIRDMNDVEVRLDVMRGMCGDEGVYVEQILGSKELLSKVAVEKRRRREDYDMGDWPAADESINEAIRELSKTNRSIINEQQT